MHKNLLAVFAVLAVSFAASSARAADFTVGTIDPAGTCEFLCSRTGLSAEVQACCGQGIDACSADFDECIEDQRVASGQICQQIDEFQAAQEEAVKNGDSAAIGFTSHEVFCCSSGYFPDTSEYDCCLAHAAGGKREVVLQCPKGSVTPGSICSAKFSDSSADFQCCVDHVNQELPPEGCPLPVPPLPPAPPTDQPSGDRPPAPEPTPPVTIPDDTTTAATEAGSLTCEAARLEDLSPGGKIIGVSSDGSLVPLVVRYHAPANAGVSLALQLTQVAGLSVAVDQSRLAGLGEEIEAPKAISTDATTSGDAEWTVYVQAPSDLRGYWDPQATFEVDVRSAADGSTIATLTTGCAPAADAKGGGCALVPGAGEKTYSDGCVFVAAIGAVFLAKRRLRRPPY